MSATNGSASGRDALFALAEALLSALAGVAAARLVPGPGGEILEIRIAADGELPERQVARNAQSALLAQLGILVDQRRITVASAPDPAPGPAGAPDAGPPDAGAAAAPLPRPRLDGLGLERIHPHRVRCRVVIAVDGGLLAGEAEVIDGPGAGLEAAARAVLGAWNASHEPDAPPFELEGVRLVEIAGRPYAVAAVRARDLRTVHFLAGAAAIEHSPEEAAAAAAIQATEHGLELLPDPMLSAH